VIDSRHEIVIRKLLEEDVAPTYVSALQDPTILRLTEARHTTWDEQAIRQYVKQHQDSTSQILFGVFLIEDNSHIGNVRIFSRNDIHERCELSIMMFGSNSRGKGYGTVAIRNATEYAFDHWNMHRVMADYYEINEASARAFEKAGFVYEGTFRDHFRLPSGEHIASIRVAKIRH